MPNSTILSEKLKYYFRPLNPKNRPSKIRPGKILKKNATFLLGGAQKMPIANWESNPTRFQFARTQNAVIFSDYFRVLL